MSTARPVIGPVPPAEVYLCWVKRSLLRQTLDPGPVDGSDHATYRAAVAAFRGQQGLPPGQAVDAPVQDRLIRLNHVDPEYAAWVQDALVRGGLMPASARETLIERAEGPARRAIQALQRAKGLAGDGWVGPKTERELRRLSTQAAPAAGRPQPCLPARGRPTPPGGDPSLQLQDLLRRTLAWMDELPSLHAAERCLARRLLDPRVHDALPQFRQFFDGNPRADVPARALRRTLAARVARLRREGLAVTPRQMADILSTELAAMRDEVRSAWKVDCTLDDSSRARRLAQRLSQDPRHPYSCPGVRSTVDTLVATVGLYACGEQP